jgi:hypothetical protein
MNLCGTSGTCITAKEMSGFQAGFLWCGTYATCATSDYPLPISILLCVSVNYILIHRKQAFFTLIAVSTQKEAVFVLL